MTAPAQTIPVAVDAMGGDHGPGVVVEGAVSALRKLGIPSIIVGDEAQIRPELDRLGASSALEVQHASQVVTMDDPPSAAIRGKPDSSIRIAFELVKQGRASAVVSPGNTGAVMAAGLYVCSTIPAIARPAIASLIPKLGDLPPAVVLDSGANTDCHASQLVQFALMGSHYAASALGISSPRVALLSNGSEASKGTDMIRSASLMLREISDINFIGYAEGRDVARDIADVIVCDGFVGNVLLKAMEGSAELVFDSIRLYTKRSRRGLLGMWLARPMLRSLFHDKLDPSAYGGAPLLGLNAVTIICHGSAKARAIKNGIRVAQQSVQQDLVGNLTRAIASLEQRVGGSYEDGLWSRMSERFERSQRRRSARREKGGEVPAADQQVDDKGSKA